jgi:hypothetical protein
MGFHDEKEEMTAHILNKYSFCYMREFLLRMHTSFTDQSTAKSRSGGKCDVIDDHYA